MKKTRETRHSDDIKALPWSLAPSEETVQFLRSNPITVLPSKIIETVFINRK